jgi:hypothetical protein
MTRIFLLIILTFFSLSSYAQTDHVITLKGDTITGKATITSGEYSIQSVVLKNGRDKTKFKVYQIKTLIKEDEVYHTLKIRGVYQLGLLKKEGYLSLYYFLDNKEISSTEFETSILIKKDGAQLITPNLGFNKQLAKFLDDCPNVQKRISEKEYKRSDLEQIIDDYNACIIKKTERLNSIKIVQNLKPDKVKQIATLLEAIKQDASLPNSDNVLEMLSDLKTKIKEGSKLPSYLTSALRDALKSNQNFAEQLEKVLE